MKLILISMVLVACLLALGACSTVGGMGKDITATAEWTKDKMQDKDDAFQELTTVRSHSIVYVQLEGTTMQYQTYEIEDLTYMQIVMIEDMQELQTAKECSDWIASLNPEQLKMAKCLQTMLKEIYAEVEESG